MTEPLAAVGDVTDFAPSPASAEDLERARQKFGLHLAQPYGYAREKEQKHKKKIAKMVKQMGTPLDVVRSMMAVPVPPAWEVDLRTISPVSEDHSFLVFAWKQPPLDHDAGRWCLYEAIPDKLIGTERRMELGGAPYWRLPTKAARFAQAQVVTAFQWAMYREHRLDVRPFWCIQGAEGGTPLHHSRMEQRYLSMMGKPIHPLHVGALAFAPWDNRVKAQVVQRDRLAKLGGSVERLRGTGTSASMIAANQEMEREYRRAFWDWFAEKLGEKTELYAHVLKHLPDGERPRQSAQEAAAAANARDYFIEHGFVPDPHVYRKKNILVAQS